MEYHLNFNMMTSGQYEATKLDTWNSFNESNQKNKNKLVECIGMVCCIAWDWFYVLVQYNQMFA